MVKSIEFLDPARKLVDEVVGWLCGGKARRTAEGALSLAHVMVVVPTAQSGRSLRLALAKESSRRGWGGIVPPRIVMPNAMLVPQNARVATEAEELAAMAGVLMDLDLSVCSALFPKLPEERGVDWALAMAGQLLEIESVLGENALLMRDVKCEEDAARWRDLAQVESAFLAALSAKGVKSRGEGRRLAADAGCVEPGVSEIALPSAVDLNGAFEKYLVNSPQRVTVLVHAAPDDAAKFDSWGRPAAYFKARVEPRQICVAPTAVVEADDVAKHFRAVDPRDALPALAVCDADSFPELEGAFQNHFSEDELVLRNPSRTAVANSSLGRLLGCILQLADGGAYDVFSTFVRSGDVARWAAVELGVSPAELASYVGALDAVQNAHLPRTIDEAVRGADAESLAAWSEAERAAAAGLSRLARLVKDALADPFGFLRRLFASRTLDEKNPADRELAAAAETVRDLREACASELVPPRLRRALYGQLLKGAAYSLEPTAPNVFATLGWLEIPWCAEDELVVSGFNEGCVPENVVGHPFVPDSLRARLGLATNESRAMRDSFIFAEALACRETSAVRVHLHQIAGDKNVMKPSRILFLGVRDDDLPRLAMRLYAVTKGNDGAPPKSLPDAWRLALPIPPAGTTFRKRMSPTALDQYRRCPFAFFLSEIFGEHSDDHSQELDALAFGTLCHAALDEFAKRGPKDSTDADEIAAFLADAVREQLKPFGSPLPAVIELQGEAAIARLRNFAPLQAKRRAAGWRIVASEQTLQCTIKNCPTLLRGKVDRIDEREATGELAIVDYKTWSRADDRRRDSLQLPIYRAMVEASNQYAPEKSRAAKAFYCVLAERAEDVMFDEEHAYGEGTQSAMEDEIVACLTNLANGIFFPPSRDSNWRENYGSLVWESPEKGIDPAWLADQAARTEEDEK